MCPTDWPALRVVMCTYGKDTDPTCGRDARCAGGGGRWEERDRARDARRHRHNPDGIRRL